MLSQLEREEQELERQFNDGEISLKEYNQTITDLQRDYHAEAEEAAQEAYEKEMGRWGG